MKIYFNAYASLLARSCSTAATFCYCSGSSCIQSTPRSRLLSVASWWQGQRQQQQQQQQRYHHSEAAKQAHLHTRTTMPSSTASTATVPTAQPTNGESASTTTDADSQQKQQRQGFSLKDYDVIGFDLDHTLARYNLPALYKLCYGSIVKHLIDLGYPKAIFREFDEDVQLRMVQKGLLYDMERGNVLKLGAAREVIRGFHGTKPMSTQSIEEIYGGKSEIGARLKHLPFIRDETPEEISKSLHCFSDYFTVGTIYLLMEIVDAIDAGLVDPKIAANYTKPFRDFFDGYTTMYRREGFREHTGYFFPEVKTNTSEMLHRCTPEILNWLKQLRSDGMKIVLITSSNADYAEMMLVHTIGKNWMDYFDSVITWARKPGFWIQSDRMFYTVKDHREADMVATLKDRTVYAQGSHARLSKLLSRITGKDQPKMIYVGDNLVDDMYVPQKYKCCDTIGIVEELELEKLPKWKSEWGPFLQADEDRNKRGAPSASLWADVVEKSCKLAVPSVEEMARYPRDHVFEKSSETCLVFS